MDCEFTRSCEDTIRRAPIASLGAAVVAGLVLTRLPLVAIFGALFRLSFALARPALVVFGILKIVELCREKGCCFGNGGPSRTE